MIFTNFEKINSRLINLYESQKLHHAILIDGKEGIGKSSFSLAFIQNILGFQSQNHPNLLSIDRADKKEITIDKIRQIADFVNKSAAVNDSKFIVIDGVCQMNKSASNALLKILEEPNSGNYLFLVSHNLSRVLPTIRSRCYIIKASPPSKQEFKRILEQDNIEISEEESHFLSSVFGDSIALAINEKENIINLYKLFLESFIADKITDNLLKLVSDKSFNFSLLAIISEFFSNRLLKSLSNQDERLFFNEKQVFSKILDNASYNKLLKQIDDSLKLANKTSPLNLDKKASLVNIFNNFNNVKNT